VLEESVVKAPLAQAIDAGPSPGSGHAIESLREKLITPLGPRAAGALGFLRSEGDLNLTKESHPGNGWVMPSGNK